MRGAGRRSMAVRVLAGVTLAGMSLLLLQPLPQRHAGPHGCDRPAPATTQAAFLAAGMAGCDHTGGVCLATTGCPTVPSVVSPTRMALPAPEPPRTSTGGDVALAADLYKAGPPTPPPNR